MVLSRRERIILIATVATLSLLALDRLVLTPLMGLRQQTSAQRDDLLEQMQAASILFQRRSLMQRKWQEMIGGGLQSDASATESAVLHALRDWSERAGLNLAALKPELQNTDGPIRVIIFQVTGMGDLQAITEFLWSVESASLPMRTVDLQISARGENADQLSIQLGLSVIYYQTLSGDTGQAMSELSEDLS